VLEILLLQQCCGFWHADDIGELHVLGCFMRFCFFDGVLKNLLLSPINVSGQQLDNNRLSELITGVTLECTP